MKIFNLHGYHGSAENAAYKALSKLECEIISPQINYDDGRADKIFLQIDQLFWDSQADIIVGTSLGGFFASLLAVKHHKPLITANPCLMPFSVLPELGFAGDIRPFVKLFGNLSEIDSEMVCAIVGGQDEVIGSHKFTEALLGNERFCIIPEGKHSGATLPLSGFFEDSIEYFKNSGII